jgi:polysaccharide chain length determinant protein (PEP-CTERM system associated)
MPPIMEQIFDELRSTWRFRWTALALAFVISICGWVVVLALPDQYEAYARIFVDTRTALKPVLQGLAVDQDVGTEVNYVRQSLLAGPQLMEIATESGVLPPGHENDKQRARILGDLSSAIVLTMKSASDRDEERNTAGQIYSVSYKDGNRARALRVVQTVMNTFVEKTLGGKLEGAATAQKFLEAQMQDYERRLRTAENRLADFKRRNVGLMPSDGVSYFSQLQTAIDGVNKTKTSLDTALARRAELTRQIHGDTAVLAVGNAPAPSASGAAGTGGDTLSRISEAQARLDELLLKFTDKHPDVIAAKQTLEDLKQRRAAEIEGLRHGDPNAAAATRASSNPVYQSLQLGLNQADVEIAALHSELSQDEEKVAELRQRLNTAPQVEAEYAQLNRDYDVNKAEYAALLANYEKAQLGEQADKAGSVRFEIVQPPTASFQPVSLKRSLLLGLVLAASVVLGSALAYGLHQLRPVVVSATGLAAIANAPVLGTVGPAFPQRTQRQTRLASLRFSMAAACLLVLFVGVMVANWAGIRLTAQFLKSVVGA